MKRFSVKDQSSNETLGKINVEFYMYLWFKVLLNAFQKWLA